MRWQTFPFRCSYYQLISTMALEDVGPWWFLISTASDNSLSLIAEANVITVNPSELEVGDEVAYIWHGNPYDGKVTDKNRK